MSPHKILIIIRRSNGDVFLSSPLKDELQRYYPDAQIDYLVNAETVAIAKTIPGIHTIFTYDHGWKKKGIVERIKREVKLFKMIFGSYDLAINLTANDRGVLYASLAAKVSVSAVEPQSGKSWWKRIFLTHSFEVNSNRHILEHNMMPLKSLGLNFDRIEVKTNYGKEALTELENLPFDLNLPFLIFHPSAQFDYKIYPKSLRNSLLQLLDTLEIPIVITGGNSEIDRKISSEIPYLKNGYDLIAKTSLQGYIALCDHAAAYIGMDTLNMHIAAAQNIPVFAIFGPTLPAVWSPWSNQAQCYTKESKPLQKYGDITLFQADMPCVACGLAGCDDQNGRSDCLYNIDPNVIFREVSKWLKK